MMPKFRVSLLSLTLLLAVPFAPRGVSKNPDGGDRLAAGNCLRQRHDRRSGHEKNHLCQPAGSGAPDGVDRKVMTAMVVLDAHLPLDEMLTVDISHTPEMKGIYSRVRLNSQISRRDMLLLALMSSENRAAASPGASLSGRLRRFYSRDERQSPGRWA